MAADGLTYHRPPEGSDLGIHVLGINPWIHDFAAFNLWSRPVGLSACLRAMRDVGCRVALADCLNSELSGGHAPGRGLYGLGRYPRTEIPVPEPVRFVPRRFSRYGLDKDLVRSVLAASEPPDCVFVTCVMTYWYPGATEAVELCRALWPETPIVLGGTYASLCREHALEHSGADLVISGPLERGDNWAAVWSLLNHPVPELPAGAGMALMPELYARPEYSPVLGSRGCPFASELKGGVQIPPN